jgi:drug/metabolite transporter (DMT)-like permease
MVPALLLWPVTTMPEQPVWLLVGALSSALAYYGLFRAFEGGPVSVGSPVIAGWALVTTVLGMVLFDERLTLVQGAGALLVVGGGVSIAALADAGTGEWLEPRARVLTWAVGSSLGFGVMVAAMQPLAHSLGPVGSLLALWGGQWLILVPVTVWRHRDSSLLPPREVWPAVVAFGLLETVGFLAVDVGTLLAPVSLVAPPASLGSLATVFLGRIWLGEEVGRARIGLAAVVVLGVILLGS